MNICKLESCQKPFEKIHKRQSYCSPECSKEAQKQASYAWKSRNPDKAREAQRIAKRKHRQTATPEQLEKEREVVRQWRKDNPEKSRDNASAYYFKHQEAGKANRKRYRAIHLSKSKQKVREWQKNNPDRVQQHSARRRAWKATAPINDFSAEQWQELLRAFENACAYCELKNLKLTVDHITPLSKGGSHTLHNIVPVCKSCNSTKHDGPPLKPVQPLLLTIAKPNSTFRPRTNRPISNQIPC